MNKVSKIFHISDIHCRTYQRHSEYKEVFNRLFKYISENKDEDSLIVISGDVVHSKTEMSPELVDIVSYLFTSLSDLCPVIVFIGNHDTNLNNPHRLDTLSPIINVIDRDNIFYLKDSTVFEYKDCNFVHFSVLDPPSKWPKKEEWGGPDKTLIGLFHGSVNGCLLDSDISYSGGVDPSIFDGLDMVLLGDIHKRQDVKVSNPTISYPGSLIQQNFGEDIRHGFLEWDVKSRTHKFVEVENDIAYVNIEIVSGKIITDLTPYSKFKFLRAKIKHNDTPLRDVLDIIESLNQKFRFKEIIYHKINPQIEYDAGISIPNLIGNIRDVDHQNELLTQFLESRGVKKGELREIYKINKENNLKIVNPPIRHQIWKILSFEFDNMFSFGENNKIDFSNFQGSYGIFAPNASGKSSILDAITYCIYDKCSRTFKAKHILNNKKEGFRCKIQFLLNGQIFYIERVGIYVKGTDNVRVEVNFYTIDPTSSEVISLNGNDRDGTNKAIRDYIGSYDDFILTTLSTQNDNRSFIDKSQRERKELLYTFLDLSIFDSLYREAKEEYKKITYELNLSSLDTINSQISETKEKFLEMSKKVTDEEEEIADLRSKYSSLLSEISTVLAQKKESIFVNYSIEEIEESIQNTTDELNVLKSKYDDQSEESRELLEDIDDLKKIIDSITPVDLEERLRDIVDYENQISNLSSKIKTSERLLDSAINVSKKLDTLEYDENCEYCISNPIVKDAREASKRIPIIQEEIESSKNLISELNNELSEFIHYRKVNSDILSKKSSLMRLLERSVDASNLLSSLEKKISEKKSSLSDLGEKQKTYYNNKEIIEFNIEIDKKLSLTLQPKRDKLEKEISNLDSSISNNKAKLIHLHDTHQDLLEKKRRYKKISVRSSSYQRYLEAMSRDGIVYELLKKSLPTIENEVNDILCQIVNFRIKIETTDENYIYVYIVYDGNQFWPVELSSGMEKFLISMAFRVCMTNITSLPRANFLAIDEGFGVLDSENIINISLLFEYLKTQFNFIMCISHIDTMKDLADHLIGVEKIDGFSKVSIS